MKQHSVLINKITRIKGIRRKVHNCQNAPLSLQRCSRMLKEGASKLSSCLTHSLLDLYCAC